MGLEGEERRVNYPEMEFCKDLCSYVKNGDYTFFEYDTQNRSMQHHKKVLPQNNPNARNKFFKVGHGK